MSFAFLDWRFVRRWRPARQWVVVAAALNLATPLNLAVAVDLRLTTAAEKSDRAALRQLLKQHVDPNAAQADGMTALHWAAHREDVEVAKLLLAASAHPNVTNHYGVTPLSLACQNGNSVLVELLLAHGANPNTALPGGETALLTAARTGKPGPVKALLARGAQIDAQERRGQTALHWAAADGHAEVVDLLLKAGANRQATLPDSGFTPLLFAVRDGRAEVVRVLLAAGDDVQAVTDPRKPGGRAPVRGSSALTLAIENGHYELALELIRSGADPNDQRSGYAPLHQMSWVRKPPRGEDNGTPPPRGSGNLNSLDFIRELVKRGADVNARLKTGGGGPGHFKKEGATPFLLAAWTADLAYLQLLKELGADPTIPNVDNCTPLIVVCGLGVGADAANEVAGEEPEVLDCLQYLLKLGADINAVDKNGETVMHAAALKNLPRVLQFLVDHGAKIETWNRKNKYGWTPLMLGEGHRPGNFKPSAETIAVIRKNLLAAGVTPIATPLALPDQDDYGPPKKRTP